MSGSRVNDRLNQLKRQASLWCDQNIPSSFSEETNGYGAAWEDKFAELIIRECMQVSMKSVGLDAEYESWYLIQQHFGIKT